MKIKFSVFAVAALSLSVFVSSPSPAGAEVSEIPVVRSGAGDAEAEKKKDVVVYTVVTDDTLWDISGKFLDTPFKWPRVWKYNPYIKNPDLIYPGDIVRITPRGIEVIGRKESTSKSLPIVSLEPVEPRVVVLEPVPVVEPPPPGPPAPTLNSDAIPRQGFISKDRLDAAGVVIGNEEDQTLFSEGDSVFLSLREGEDAAPGDDYTIFIVESEIIHPNTKKSLGYIIDILGSIKLTGTEGVVAGTVKVGFKEIPKGAKIEPFRIPPADIEITSAGASVKGIIVAALEGKENLTARDIVYLDKGSDDGLAKGNIMRIYRPGKEVPNPHNKKKKIQFPQVALGNLLVTETEEGTSTAVVIKSLQAIVMGDRVSTIDQE